MVIAAAMAVPAESSCGRACKIRKADEACSQKRVLPCIRRASLTYRQTRTQRAWMVRVARCESGLSPYARNPSGSFGLYQFMRGTWLSTRYASKDWTRAKWQALAAAWMVKQGRQGEWVCR